MMRFPVPWQHELNNRESGSTEYRHSGGAEMSSSESPAKPFSSYFVRQGGPTWLRPRQRLRRMSESAATKSSTERIFGTKVISHGYTDVPNIFLRGQKRLGISASQFNIIAKLLSYLHAQPCSLFLPKDIFLSQIIRKRP